MRIFLVCEPVAIASLHRDCRKLGSELASRGHEVVYGVSDPIAFAETSGGANTEAVLPIPVLREAPALVMKRRAPGGMDDMMAIAGFASSGHLATLAGIWRKQIDLLRPDAIAGFGAPLLWLVGPAFAPTFALGSGNFLPPVIGSGFPRLSATTAPLAADHVMVRNANEILASLRLPPLDGLSDVVSRCHSLLYGLPHLDPHIQLRKQSSFGVLGQPAALHPAPTGNRLAAFLDVFSPNIEALLLGIAGTDQIECDVHVSGATAGMLRFLQQQPNLKVWSDCEKLAGQMSGISGIIHHGETHLAETGLLAGLPQLILPFLDHQTITVGNFSWMGSVLQASASDSIADNSGLLKSFSRNTSLAVHARHHAAQMQAGGIQNALPLLADRITHLSLPRAAVAAN